MIIPQTIGRCYTITTSSPTVSKREVEYEKRRTHKTTPQIQITG